MIDWFFSAFQKSLFFNRVTTLLSMSEASHDRAVHKILHAVSLQIVPSTSCSFHYTFSTYVINVVETFALVLFWRV